MGWLSGLLVASERVEILSDRFEADEVKRMTTFWGHVRMKKGRDELNASKVVVHFDAERRPTRYEASGGAKFRLYMKKGEQLYTGRADRLIYEPAKGRYELVGGVVLNEPNLSRTLKGERVTVDRVSGKASVEGEGDKPVKFIFKVDDDGAHR